MSPKIGRTVRRLNERQRQQGNREIAKSSRIQNAQAASLRADEPAREDWRSTFVMVVLGTGMLCGASMAALMNSNLTVVMAVDRSQDYLTGYSLIHGHHVPNIYLGNAEDVPRYYAALAVGDLLRSVDALVVSLSCKYFSLLGSAGEKHCDKCCIVNTLRRAVVGHDGWKPPLICIENVVNALNKHVWGVTKWLEILDEAGYRVVVQVVENQWHEVPMSRTRLLVTAFIGVVGTAAYGRYLQRPPSPQAAPSSIRYFVDSSYNQRQRHLSLTMMHSKQTGKRAIRFSSRHKKATGASVQPLQPHQLRAMTRPGTGLLHSILTVESRCLLPVIPAAYGGGVAPNGVHILPPTQRHHDPRQPIHPCLLSNDEWSTVRFLSTLELLRLFLHPMPKTTITLISTKLESMKLQRNTHACRVMRMVCGESWTASCAASYLGRLHECMYMSDQEWSALLCLEAEAPLSLFGSRVERLDGAACVLSDSFSEGSLPQDRLGATYPVHVLTHHVALELSTTAVGEDRTLYCLRLYEILDHECTNDTYLVLWCGFVCLYREPGDPMRTAYPTETQHLHNLQTEPTWKSPESDLPIKVGRLTCSSYYSAYGMLKVCGGMVGLDPALLMVRVPIGTLCMAQHKCQWTWYPVTILSHTKDWHVLVQHDDGEGTPNEELPLWHIRALEPHDHHPYSRLHADNQHTADGRHVHGSKAYLTQCTGTPPQQN